MSLSTPGSAKSRSRTGDERLRAAVDLAFVLGFFLLANLAEPYLDSRLRRGTGLTGVSALALYQFVLEGLAVLLVIAVRRERFAGYGFVRPNALASVTWGVSFAVLYDLALSSKAGALIWIPFRRHSAIRMSIAAGLPLSIIGISLTVLVWAFFEAFFGVFFARKINQIFSSKGRGWLAPGALTFALFNGLIHLAIGQGLEGFAFSFASGYAIAVIPSVCGNAWGGVVVQALTNAVGTL